MTGDDKPADTELKKPWLRLGEQREETFLTTVAPKVGLSAREHPAKATDPTALDLLVAGTPADLKTQETPFFTAKKQYDLPPQYVVTFNRNDYQRYRQKPAVDIYVWVRWQDELSGWGTEVEEMEGVWRTGVAQIEATVEAEQAPLHQYKRRQGDQENANASYLLALRAMDCLGCFTGPCAQQG